MSAAWLGTNTLVALSLPEVTYGTEVSRVATGVARSCTLHKKVTNAKVDNLSSYLGGALDMVQTDSVVEGTTTFDLCYSGNLAGILLVAAFGAVAESGGGPYVHTITMAEALKSFSAAITRGTSGNTEEFYGLVASKTVIKIDSRGPCSIETTWVGKNAGARGSASPSLPAVAARSFTMGHHLGDFTFNSVAYTCRSMTITIDNKVELLKEHGSITPSEAVRSDRAEVTIDLELHKRVETLYTATLAGTVGTWSCTASLSTASFAFSGPAAFVETHDDALDKNGTIIEKVKLQCLASAGSAGMIQVVLTNGDVTYGVS